jgi:hypothetical protein
MIEGPQIPLNLGVPLPADKEILYQPEYWSDRADDLRRLADAFREEVPFFDGLNRTADIFERLARYSLVLRQKRANYLRRPPKYHFGSSLEAPKGETVPSHIVDINYRPVRRKSN